MPDDTRDPGLEAFADKAGHYLESALDQYEATHGRRPQYLLICLDGLIMETVAEISDHDLLFDAMTKIGASWVEEGHVTIDDTTPESDAPRLQ